MSKSGTNILKGKTWEEIYGVQKAKRLKEQKRKLFKNKTFIERYGKQRALQITKKISIKSKGRKLTKTQHDAIIMSNKTRQITKVTRLKMSASHKGYKWSNKSKEKNRLSHTGEKNHFFGKRHNKQTILKIKKSRQYIKMPNKDTIPELKVQKILKDNKILFEKHKIILGRPDVFVKPNICIFVDGDYWHANPIKYKKDDIISKSHYSTASKIWARDKKITNKLNLDGYNVVRIWENDINNNINKVEKDILKYIRRYNK